MTSISASLRPGNTASFEEMLQRWRAVGNTASDLTGPSFEPWTSRFRDEEILNTAKDRFVFVSHSKVALMFCHFEIHSITLKEYCYF